MTRYGINETELNCYSDFEKFSGSFPKYCKNENDEFMIIDKLIDGTFAKYVLQNNGFKRIMYFYGDGTIEEIYK